jgi:hypothetical protein
VITNASAGETGRTPRLTLLIGTPSTRAGAILSSAATLYYLVSGARGVAADRPVVQNGRTRLFERFSTASRQGAADDMPGHCADRR